MHNSPSSLFAAALALGSAVAQNDMLGVSFAGAAYVLSSTSGTGSLLGASGAGGLNSMARVGGAMISVATNGNVVAIDPATGVATTLVATSPTLDSVRGLAADAAGTLYAIQNGGGPGSVTVPDLLYTIDLGTGVASLIGSASYSGLQGLAIDLAGTLYSFDVGSGSGFGAGLVTIDPVTAASIDVNPAVGGSASEVQCLATSPAGVLFGARNSLFAIDAITGIATLVGSGGYTDLRGIDFLPLASCTLRNGNGINPLACVCATLPVLGTNWTISVTPAASTVLTLVFASFAPLPGPVPLFGGEVLIAPPVVDIGPSGLGVHVVPVPASQTLVGLALYLQGLRVNALPAGLALELTNGQDAVLGL